MSIGYLDGQGCRIHGSNPTGSKKSAKIQTTPLHTLSKKKSDARYQLLALSSYLLRFFFNQTVVRMTAAAVR